MTTKRKTAGTKNGLRTVEEFGNTWTDVVPATRDDLHVVAQALGVRFDKQLAELLHRCNAGRPQKPYFRSDSLRREVHIGELLPLFDLPNRRGLLTRTLVQRQVHGMPTTLVPFATDNGNAGLYALDAKTSRIVYWVHGSQEGSPVVAESLSELLAGLTDPPY
jgi:hypothetical protein